MINLPKHVYKYHLPSYQPNSIKFKCQGTVCHLSYPNNEEFLISSELLRVYSPMLKIDQDHFRLTPKKRGISISGVEKMQYGIRVMFSDGYDRAIYCWEDLYQIGKFKYTLSKAYLEALRKHNRTREPRKTDLL